MPVLLNNCRNRRYLSHYQPAEGESWGKCVPFYDLFAEGPQADQARGLAAGRVCVVASYDEPDHTRVRFDWFAFSHEAVMRDRDGAACRVLFGTFLRDQTLEKVEAVRHPDYAAFFNAVGHFKQQSVVLETE